jgi:hypothetical protein
MPPSRSGPPGSSRCVSCPIPMRGSRVARSPGFRLTDVHHRSAEDYNGPPLGGQRERGAAELSPEARCRPSPKPARVERVLFGLQSGTDNEFRCHSDARLLSKPSASRTWSAYLGG